jgi:phosphatidylethanolamine-binding protein (PEBP) family uncharacterized protein
LTIDRPLPSPINHGIYYSIPAAKTSIVYADFEKSDAAPSNSLRGGFKYGANLRKSVYSGPRALKGHGPHRYYYQVIGLNESLKEGLSPVATRAELVKAVEGKVLGWGLWIGISERKFK